MSNIKEHLMHISSSDHCSFLYSVIFLFHGTVFSPHLVQFISKSLYVMFIFHLVLCLFCQVSGQYLFQDHFTNLLLAHVHFYFFLFLLFISFPFYLTSQCIQSLFRSVLVAQMNDDKVFEFDRILGLGNMTLNQYHN